MLKRISAVALSLVLSVSSTLITSCSSEPAARGGDATCVEFNAMSDAEKAEAVTLLLAEDGKEPADEMVKLTVVSASLYCTTVGKDSSPIRNIKG